jgi:hypothetical protein
MQLTSFKRDKRHGHQVEGGASPDQLWFRSAFNLAFIPAGNAALDMGHCHTRCHTLFPLAIDCVLNLAELLSMLYCVGQDMLLVKEDVAPLFVIVEIVRKVNAPIHVQKCIAWHAFLQQCDGIDWTSSQPTIIDQWKSPDQPALLATKHLSDVVQQDPVPAIRVKPLWLPPFIHEVHHVQLHPPHEETSK